MAAAEGTMAQQDSSHAFQAPVLVSLRERLNSLVLYSGRRAERKTKELRHGIVLYF